ncbi:hypothetical protein ACQY0O_002305 [Thecaphora frezii]
MATAAMAMAIDTGGNTTKAEHGRRGIVTMENKDKLQQRVAGGGAGEVAPVDAAHGRVSCPNRASGNVLRGDRGAGDGWGSDDDGGGGEDDGWPSREATYLFIMAVATYDGRKVPSGLVRHRWSRG